MRSKIPELQLALEGAVSEHHRFLLKQHLDHVQDIEQCLHEHTVRIEAPLASLEAGPPSPPDDPPNGAPDRSPDDIGGAISFSEAQATIVAIPGSDAYSAPDILAEIGADMSQYRSDSNRGSCSKLCPGSHFDRLNAEQIVKHHKRRIESFNLTVTLTPKPMVA